LGVISFQLDGIHHAKVAAILAFEHGIGVRDGCFCAHPYILHLLQVNGEAYERFKQQVLNQDRSEVPGLVRVSFGCYNTHEEVDYLLQALGCILRGEYHQDYVLDKMSGSYYPKGYDHGMLKDYFDI
jgi:cysteine desulfurase / selenocysteine lyase